MTEEIVSLAARINETFAESQALADGVREHATAAVAKAVECGRLMLEQKEALQRSVGKERPGWLDWLEVNCPSISEQTARRYMTLAKRSHVSGCIEDCSTLRQAYVATGIIKEGDKKPKEEASNAETPWVRYVKPLDAFRRWYLGRVEESPMASWDEDALRLLQNELQWFSNLHDEIKRLRDSR
jgi:hypothetical protein